MGFSLSGGCVVFSKNKFCISNGTITNTDYNVFPIDDFVELRIESSGFTSDSVFLNYKHLVDSPQISLHLDSSPICRNQLHY